MLDLSREFRGSGDWQTAHSQATTGTPELVPEPRTVTLHPPVPGAMRSAPASRWMIPLSTPAESAIRTTIIAEVKFPFAIGNRLAKLRRIETVTEDHDAGTTWTRNKR